MFTWMCVILLWSWALFNAWFHSSDNINMNKKRSQEGGANSNTSRQLEENSSDILWREPLQTGGCLSVAACHTEALWWVWSVKRLIFAASHWSGTVGVFTLETTLLLLSCGILNVHVTSTNESHLQHLLSDEWNYSEGNPKSPNDLACIS